MLWIITVSFFTLVGLLYVPAVIFRRIQIVALRRRSKGKLVLTYDDGPGAHITPQILRLLKCHDAKASFFLTGFRAAECKKIWQDAIAQGHDVGSHSYWHHDAWRKPVQAVASLLKGCRQVAAVPGASRLFRPPHGKATTLTYLAAKMCGCQHAFWTVDARDYLEPPASVEDVVAEVRRKGGGVVLLHDLETGAPGEEQRHSHLLSLTDQLISLARVEQWQICTMSELPNKTRGASKWLTQ